MKLIIGNHVDLEKKIDNLRRGKAQRLQIIVDFDRTLTPSQIAGQEAINSSAILRMSGALGPKFAEIYDQLFQKYYPLEIDPSLTKEEKLPLMAEWTLGIIQALKDNGLTWKMLQGMVDSGMVKLRVGVERFLEIACEKGIPVVVFSAGVGDVISLVLEKAGVKTENVHIIANFYEFGSAGEMLGLKGKLINIMNKSEVVIEEKSFYHQLVERNNVLLIGDSLHDVHMADGIPHNSVLKVGLLNHPSELSQKKYSEAFDIVLEGDGDFHEATLLLKEILAV